MAVYFVTGKLGSGKTLCAVGKLRDYLEQGRRVATNLDIDLTKMLPKTSKQTLIRLPDKPRRCDLEMLGRGCEEEREDRYGAIVLDELATWFNSRNWRDKERLEIIDWFLHARKYHWDIYFIVQDIDSLDSQLINALCEHLVVCKRTDRLSIPVISSLARVAGIEKVLPKIHIASVFYGQNTSSIRVARWIYKGKDLYPAYNTAQVFTDQLQVLGGEVVDMRASYTQLSPYYRNSFPLIHCLQAQLSELTGQAKPNRTAARLGVLAESGRFARQLVLALALFIGAGIWWMPKAGATKPGKAAPPVASAPAKPAQPPAKDPSPQPASSPAVALREAEAKAPPPDAIQDMLDGARLRLVAYSHDGDKLLSLRIEATKGELTRQLTRQELILAGYSVIPSNLGVELVKGPRRFIIPKA
jgi:hypothetical protein